MLGFLNNEWKKSPQNTQYWVLFYFFKREKDQADVHSFFPLLVW